MQIMAAHGVQEKDLAGVDFSKGIFSSKKAKFGGDFYKGKTAMQANFGTNVVNTKYFKE